MIKILSVKILTAVAARSTLSIGVPPLCGEHGGARNGGAVRHFGQLLLAAPPGWSVQLLAKV